MFGLPPSSHAAIPEDRMTDGSAHRVMQSHLECSIEDCAVKAQAHRHLVSAGKLVPATDPHFGY